MALLIVQNPRLQTGQGVQPCHGSNFPARQHKVAQADLGIHMTLDETLVNALVAAAQQHHAIGLSAAHYQALVQDLAHR